MAIVPQWVRCEGASNFPVHRAINYRICSPITWSKAVNFCICFPLHASLLHSLMFPILDTLEKFASTMIPANTFNGNLVAPERRCPTDTVRRRHVCKPLRNVVLSMHTGLTAIAMIDISVRRSFGHLQLSLISKSKNYCLQQVLLTTSSSFFIHKGQPPCHIF